MLFLAGLSDTDTCHDRAIGWGRIKSFRSACRSQTLQNVLLNSMQTRKLPGCLWQAQSVPPNHSAKLKNTTQGNNLKHLPFLQTDLFCEREEDRGERLVNLAAQLVLWYSPVSLSWVGGELTGTAGGCCSFRTSVLAPEAVVNMNGSKICTKNHWTG